MKVSYVFLLMITVWRSCVIVCMWYTVAGVCVCVCGQLCSLSHRYWIPTVRAICLTLTQYLTVTPSERREETEFVCVCVWACVSNRKRYERGCLVPYSMCTSQFLALALWSCEHSCCLESANCAHTQTPTHSTYTHSLQACTTHFSYSQHDSQVSPLAPGQVNLWPFKNQGIPGRHRRARGDNINPEAAVNI